MTTATHFIVGDILVSPNGSASAPGHSFINDPNTGFYSVSADVLGITTGGAVMVQVNTAGVGIGVAAATSRLTIQTGTSFAANSQDIYHYAQQTDPANQTSPLVVHNYTDGVSMIIDTVGAGYSLRLKQAHNASARPDKPSTYVGTGPFLDLQRAKIDGLGPWPNGNIGGDNDRLTFFNETGNLCFYGTDGEDWDGTDDLAPIQIGTYANFLNRKLYMGYNNTLNKAIIGSIDSDASAFTYIDVACLGLRPIGDNAISLGASSLCFTYVHTYNLTTKPVAVTSLPAAGTAGAGTRAFVTDSSVAASGNFGATVAGGGANPVPVFSNGTNWLIG